ncbi:MAG: hypothetical protein CMF27_03940 [Kiritimatiellaceae bacterium]|jgi:hypothetical protein|nr:hypothetical protein [Kiritimatiellaceae bacterium]|tara:strand:- start:4055 stop:4735 length:681 start_codon:yes stop_codon:yes gene_type:complete
MSIKRSVNIACPGCGTTQDITLVEVLNAQTDPDLKEDLMHNRLNRVSCSDCDIDFRVDLPLLYTDAKAGLMIHWVPENDDANREQILEEFDEVIERMNAEAGEEVSVPNVRLVMNRVELVELIYMIEAGMNQRVVEYVKYSIYTRNQEKLDPERHRMLLNVEDSTDDELLFVMQDVDDRELGQVLRYGRSAYESLLELFADEPEEFMEMFPGPCISARDVLLEDRA